MTISDYPPKAKNHKQKTEPTADNHALNPISVLDSNYILPPVPLRDQCAHSHPASSYHPSSLSEVLRGEKSAICVLTLGSPVGVGIARTWVLSLPIPMISHKDIQDEVPLVRFPRSRNLLHSDNGGVCRELILVRGNNIDKFSLDRLGEKCPLLARCLGHVVHGYVCRAIFDGLDQLRFDISRGGHFRGKCSGRREDCLKAQILRFAVLKKLKWRFGDED